MAKEVSIPRDLIEKAIVIYDALGRGQTLDERTIARAFHQVAIAARRDEREKIAREVECDCCDACGESPGYPLCANEIAAAIRSTGEDR